MALLPEERENCMVFDEKTNKYHIYCSSPKEKTRMKKAGFLPYKVDSNDSWFIEVERSQISFRKVNDKPKQKREMSEEHKEKLRLGREQRKKNKEGG